jgi:hypothetical protein
LNHHASPEFWQSYRTLPVSIQRLGLHHRAVGIAAPDGIVWFWIGPHGEYDKLIG